jgi:hypothetical protein
MTGRQVPPRQVQIAALRRELRKLLLLDEDGGQHLGLGQLVGEIVDELQELGVAVPRPYTHRISKGHHFEIRIESLTDDQLWELAGGRGKADP